VGVSANTTWQQFDKLLKTLFPNKYSSKNCLVQYIDEEGDFITITTNKEWLTALTIMKDQPLIKIFIKQQQQFEAEFGKDSPKKDEKEEIDFVNNDNETQTNHSRPSCLAEIVQDLTGIIKGNKILKINIPEWLLESFKSKIDGDDVEIEIDTELISQCLLERGLSFLQEDKDYQLAKYDFQLAYLFNPSNLQSLYLLSLAQTHLQQNNIAHECLQFAFENGLSQVQLDEYKRKFGGADNQSSDSSKRKEEPSQQEEEEEEEKEEEEQEKKEENNQEEIQVFQSQLQILKELGFSNTDSNLAGLIATNGDVNMVINLLLGNNSN
jgi:hypothetical protein